MSTTDSTEDIDKYEYLWRRLQNERLREAVHKVNNAGCRGLNCAVIDRHEDRAGEELILNYFKELGLEAKYEMRYLSVKWWDCDYDTLFDKIKDHNSKELPTPGRHRTESDSETEPSFIFRESERNEPEDAALISDGSCEWYESPVEHESDREIANIFRRRKLIRERKRENSRNRMIRYLRGVRRRRMRLTRPEGVTAVENSEAEASTDSDSSDEEL